MAKVTIVKPEIKHRCACLTPDHELLVFPIVCYSMFFFWGGGAWKDFMALERSYIGNHLLSSFVKSQWLFSRAKYLLSGI